MNTDINAPVYVPDEKVEEFRKLGLGWPENQKMTYMTLLKILPSTIIFGKNRDKFYTLSVSPLYGITYAAHDYTDEELGEEGMTGLNAGIFYVCSTIDWHTEKRTFEDCLVETMLKILKDKDAVLDWEHIEWKLK